MGKTNLKKTLSTSVKTTTDVVIGRFTNFDTLPTFLVTTDVEMHFHVDFKTHVESV